MYIKKKKSILLSALAKNIVISYFCAFLHVHPFTWNDFAFIHLQNLIQAYIFYEVSWLQIFSLWIPIATYLSLLIIHHFLICLKINYAYVLQPSNKLNFLIGLSCIILKPAQCLAVDKAHSRGLINACWINELKWIWI